MKKEEKEKIAYLEGKARLIGNDKILDIFVNNLSPYDARKVKILKAEIERRMRPLNPESEEKNGHRVCTQCGQNVSIRELNLYSGMVMSLIRIEKWCNEKGVHEFIRKDIEHLLEKNEKARFGDWVYFGGIIYSRGKGKWGINLPRAEQFLNGQLEIYTRAEINPLNKDVQLFDKRTVHGIKNLKEFLDNDNYFQAKYKLKETLL